MSHGNAFRGARDEPGIAFDLFSSQEETLASLLERVRSEWKEYAEYDDAKFKIRAKYVAPGSSVYALNHV